jgi:DNA-binding response OmpR family regulator
VEEEIVYKLEPTGRTAPRQLRILVVDDDHDTVLSLVMLLRCDGHEVRGLYRGEEVTEAVREFDADVVLLDIGLPDVDGYRVAKALRSRYREHCPLLIAVTGRNRPEDRVVAREAGFDHYLPKPYNADVLLGFIEPLRLRPRIA